VSSTKLTARCNQPETAGKTRKLRTVSQPVERQAEEQREAERKKENFKDDFALMCEWLKKTHEMEAQYDLCNARMLSQIPILVIHHKLYDISTSCQPLLNIYSIHCGGFPT